MERSFDKPADEHQGWPFETSAQLASLAERLIALMSDVVPSDEIEVRLKVKWKDGTSDNARTLEELRNAAILDLERRIDDVQVISLAALHHSSERGVLELNLYAFNASGRHCQVAVRSNLGMSVSSARGLLVEADALLDRAYRSLEDALPVPRTSPEPQAEAVAVVAPASPPDAKSPVDAVVQAGSNAWHRHPVLVAVVPILLAALLVALGLNLK